MNPVIRKFRSAIGGFNRHDVLEYIAQSAEAHRREVAELEKELTRSEKERVVLETTLSGLEDEKGTVAAEEARVRSSLEKSTETLTKLRGELSETETMLAAAKAELEQLRRQVGELTPMASNYQELKDRVATVELDAHRKAQATVDEANRYAQQIHEEARIWLEGVSAQYAEIRRTMESMFAGARTLSDLEEQMKQADTGMAQLKDHAAE